MADPGPGEVGLPDRLRDYRGMVRRFYDEIAPAYERVWGESWHFGISTGEPDRAQAVAAAEELVARLAGIGPTDRVLDIGCGIGGVTRAMARRTGARVCGLDLGGVNVQRAGALGRAQDSGAAFLQADAMELPFADESFDVVYGFESGCHFPDLDRWARECRRVLVPGGRLLAYEWLAGRGLDERQRALNEAVSRGFALVELRSLDQVAGALRAAGLTVCQVRDLSAEGLIEDNWRALSTASGFADPRFGEGGRRLVAAARAGAFIIGLILARRPEATDPRAGESDSTDCAVSVQALGGGLPSSPWRGEARLTGPGGEPVRDLAGRPLVGVASGETAAVAGRRAVMEAHERHAQFGGPVGVEVREGRREEVPGALDPAAFGLYAPRQYAAPGFWCRAFDEEASYRWVAVTALDTGEEAWLPVEFVYPGTVSAPLVRETSAGTAAHDTGSAATTAALLELIERDALLRWWYQRQSAHPVLFDGADWADVRADIEALNGRGYVVLPLRLDAALNLPTHAMVALRGTGSYVGAASGLDAAGSVRHALRELGRTVADWEPVDTTGQPALSADRVHTGADDHLLYRQPVHARAFRGFLAQSVGAPVPCTADEGTVASAVPLWDRLVSNGFAVYASTLADIGGPGDGTPTAERRVVVRALVPGLVPFHVGFNRERLGHPRLLAHGARRLVTLLPHPFS